MSTSRGRTSVGPGMSRTSSKVSPSLILSPNISGVYTRMAREVKELSNF
jgi:hypothetical protein